MESGPGSWTETGSSHFLWELGTPQNAGPSSAYSGSKCWGTVIDGIYTNLSVMDYLITPLIDLTGVSEASLSFWHYYDLGNGCGNCDGGNISISTDGINYTTIGSTAFQYNYNWVVALDTKGWSGENNGWIQSIFDLTDYAGRQIYIRFNFGTYDSFWGNIDASGWYIDDVLVTDTIPNDGSGMCIIFPSTIDSGVTTSFEIEFTAEFNLNYGNVTIDIPFGWPAPSTIPSEDGYCTLTPGTGMIASDLGILSVIGNTIIIPITNMGTDDSFKVIYGDKSGGGSGATVPVANKTNIFTVKSKGSEGILTEIKNSPYVIITNIDGTGYGWSNLRSSSPNYKRTWRFYYRAYNDIAEGELTIEIPIEWTAPQMTNNSALGYLRINYSSPVIIGTATITGSGPWIISIPITKMPEDRIIYIYYGYDGSSTNARVPAPDTFGQEYAFTMKMRGAGGVLTEIPSSPKIKINADGSGIFTVSPTNTVPIGSQGTWTITYTAEYDLSGGSIRIRRPSYWSDYNTTNPTQPGYTTVNITAGTPVINNINNSSSYLYIYFNSMHSGDTVTITYGDTSGGAFPNAKVTVSSNPGNSYFRCYSRSLNGNDIELKNSPIYISVSGDGTGIAEINPSIDVLASITNTWVFTYTFTANLDWGAISIDIPQGWTQPQTGAPSGLGYVTAKEGTGMNPGDINFYNVTSFTTINVYFNNIDPGDQVIITYGDTSLGSPGAVSPAAIGTYNFTVKSRDNWGPDMASINESPFINVVPLDGSGYASISPHEAFRGALETYKIIYTASGGISPGGEVTIDIPSDWTEPNIASPSSTGYIAIATQNQVSIGTPSITGLGPWTISIPINNMRFNTSFTLYYGDMRYGGPGALAPNVAKNSAFITKMKGPAGVLTELPSSPVVSIVDYTYNNKSGLYLIKNRGGTISIFDDNVNDGATSVSIPAGALPDDCYVYIEEVPDSKIPSAGNNPYILSPQCACAYNFYIKDNQFSNPQDLVFNKKVKITLRYDDINNDGYQDNTNPRVDETRLRIFYWDKVKWILIGGEGNWILNTVSAEVDHFSMYALFPVNDRGLEALKGSDKIKLEQVSSPIFTPMGDILNAVQFHIAGPSDEKIKINIIDITGNIIRCLEDKLDNTGRMTVSWNGKDENDEMVETGVYIYQVTANNKLIKSGPIVVAK